MNQLVIFGTGVMARLVHYYFCRDSQFQVLGFTVNRDFLKDQTFQNLPVFPFEELESTFPKDRTFLFVALGPNQMNTQREKVYDLVKAQGYRLASYVSPHAICGSPVGDNCFVGDGVNIHPFAQLGSNVTLWDRSIVAHDARVEDHCYLAPQSVVSAFGILGHHSILGTSAVINTRVEVAPRCLIGAQCLISQKTEESGVYGEKGSKFYGPLSHKVSIS